MHLPSAETRDFPFAVTDDAVLGGRLKLTQPARGHRAGHDAILLAAAAPRVRRAVDLGAGIGTAGLALLVRGAARQVTMVEIDGDLAALAALNAERNGLTERVAVVEADVARLGMRTGPREPAAGAADLVIMNPPFNDPARGPSPKDVARRRAHTAPTADLAQWITAADRLLRVGGYLVLIHRPEALATILGSLAGSFGSADVIPIHPRREAGAVRVIVRAEKGRRGPLGIRPGFILENESGRPSPEAELVLRGAGSLDQR